MPFFTSQYLKSKSSERLITEDRRLFSARDKSNLKFDIFLSHSFLDKEEVYGLYLELKSMGYSVYVDWIVDSDLDRTNITKQTAELIRGRMNNSKSLILAVSVNAAMSKWMPWELGYVDGKTGRCAIAPVAKDNYNHYSFNRIEYLKLYPYLDRSNDTLGKMRLWIREEINTYIVLESWLEGSNPRKRG